MFILLNENLPEIVIKVVVQLLSCIWLFATPWTTVHQASLSFIITQSFLKLISTESVMISNNFILWYPLLSCPQFLPASRSFPVCWLFASGGQSIGASVSALVLLMNIQGWYPLGLTGLSSLQSKGLLRVFFSPTVRKHQFLGTQSSLWSNSQIHTWLLEKP